MMRNVMVGIGMMLGMALTSEARDWGFSKDTVYKWNPGADSVWLVNNSADTLLLESFSALDVDTSEWGGVSFHYHPFDGLHHFFSLSEESRLRQVPDGRRVLPPTESVMFHDFFIGPPQITAKSAYALMSQQGDTIKVGLRFLAEGGEADTLIVVGIFSYGSSLNPRFPFRLQGSPMILDRDLRGRRIKPAGNLPILKR